MLGVIVNVMAVVCGSMIGLCIKTGLSEKLSNSIMSVMGLATTYIAITGIVKGTNTLVIILSLVLGTIIGEIIDIDSHIIDFGEFLKRKFSSKSKNPRFVEGFVSASILFEVGAMAIIGSIDAGLRHDYNVFFTKSIIDFVTSIILASSMGVGVAFSGISMFLYQGVLTLFASCFTSLADNVVLMNDITCVGSIMILGISLNMLGLTKIKVANMVPAIVLVSIISYIIVR